MKESILYVAVAIGMVLLVWFLGSMFAKFVSDHKVISPAENVQCVVVSRMFNTSVDCWIVERLNNDKL